MTGALEWVEGKAKEIHEKWEKQKGKVDNAATWKLLTQLTGVVVTIINLSETEKNSKSPIMLKV